MQNKVKISAEIKLLIAKSNALFNSSQNKQQVTAYLYIIFSLLALSFFGLFAIGPTFTTISDLQKQFEEKSVAYKQLQDKNSALKSLSAQYIEIQDKLGLIDKAIPQSANVAQLTRQLEQLSLKNSLVVEKIDTGIMELYPAKNVNSPIFSFTFSIVVTGVREDINKFISDIISMERIISIDKLSTGKKTESTSTASITGKAFFYKE